MEPMAESPNKKTPPRILVVEDDKDIADMLKQILGENGYEVHHAAEGKVAIQLLNSLYPDLVLLDLQIPERTGFELLNDIRKKDQEFGLFVPVIILTGVYTSRDDKVQSLNAGADDFLHKPFDLVELLARVKSLLRVRDLYKRSQYLATHDHLTRCYNRRYLLDFINREHERFKRFKKQFSYLLLDMDHFKEINDELGHEAGDECLVYVGLRLHDFFRAVDCVARLGGDEFAVVLPDCGLADAMKVGDRLMAEISKPDPSQSLPEKLQSKIKFSVGIACLPEHTKDKEELMRLADEAMYEAKKAGRNKFRVYHS